jgi:YggT family protein
VSVAALSTWALSTLVLSTPVHPTSVHPTSVLATSAAGNVVYTVAWIYFVVLITRLVFEYVFMFAREYTPTGAVLVIVEAVYTVTDPPLKLLRRFIPPLRLGGVAIDLSFLVLIILVNLVIRYSSRF